MCYLQIDCVQMYTVIGNLLRQLMLKLREGETRLQLQRFCNLFQLLAAENWKEWQPKKVLALGMTSEIYLLECVLWVGVAMVTSELR